MINPHISNRNFFRLLLAWVLFGSLVVKGQTYTVLYSFAGTPDGAGVYGPLALDSYGNLYGTSLNGGSGQYAPGLVFKVDPSGKETILYNFTGGDDGAYPFSNLVHDAAGNLYGTTWHGGVAWAGTVFKLDPSGNESVMHSFGGPPDGDSPTDLVADDDGNLYGTTWWGGTFNDGTIFKLDSAGTETIIHNFSWEDGANPISGLIWDSEGNLYGTTFGGGVSGYGVVFKLATNTNTLTVLYSFTGGVDGAWPYFGHLLRDPLGNLYGTTSAGGRGCNAYGCGTVYRLDANGMLTTLYAFRDRKDGAGPTSGLVRVHGKFYGTTHSGGVTTCTDNNYPPYVTGCGTVFMLDAKGRGSVLHTFTGGEDGGNPVAGLIADSAGNLYGAASSGGAHGAGVVFKITFP